MKDFKKYGTKVFEVNPQSPEVDALLKCIESRTGLLSKYIREVHDCVVHFSDFDIEDDMKSVLFFMAELSELIEDIERTSPAKK